MKKLVVAGVSLMALAGASRVDAADLFTVMPVKAQPAPATHNWTGFYLGGHIGYALGSSNWSATPGASVVRCKLRVRGQVQRYVSGADSTLTRANSFQQGDFAQCPQYPM